MNKKRLLKVTAWTAAGILGAALLLSVLLYAALRSERVAQRFLIPRIESALGVEISASRVDLRPFSALEVQDLLVRNERTEILRADRLQLLYNPRALFERTVEITSLTLERPRLALSRSENGTWNIPQPDPAPPAPESAPIWEVKVAETVVDDGAVTLSLKDSSGTAVYHLAGLNGEVRNLAPGAQARFELSGTAAAAPMPVVDAGIERFHLHGSLHASPGWSPQQLSVEGQLFDTSVSLRERRISEGSLLVQAYAERTTDGWHVREFSFEEATTGGRPPSSWLRIAATVDPSGATSEPLLAITADIQNADLRLINLALTPRHRLFVSEGTLNADVKATLNQDGNLARGRGSVDVENLNLSGTALEDLDIRVLPRLRLDLEAPTLRWDTTTVRAQRAGSTVLDVTSSGEFNFEQGRGKTSLTVPLLETTVVNSFFARELLPLARLKGSASLGVSPQLISWEDLTLVAVRETEDLVNGTSSGSYSFDSGVVQVSADLRHFDQSVVQHFFPEQNLPAFAAQGEMRLSYEPKPRAIRASGDLTFIDLQLRQSSSPTDARISFSIERTQDQLQAEVSHARFTVPDVASVAFEGSASASGTVEPKRLQLSGSAHASEVDVDLLRTILSTSGELVSAPSERARFSRTAGDPDGSTSERAFELAFDVHADSLRWRDLTLESLTGTTRYVDHTLTIDLPRLSLAGQPGSLRSQFHFSVTPLAYEISATLGALDLGTLHRTLQPQATTVVSGRARDVRLQASGQGTSQAYLEETFRGELSASLGDVMLPAELRTTVPFNIIFIPFEAVAAVGRLLPTALIPDLLETAASNITGALRENQQVKIREGEIRLEAAQGKIEVSNFVVGTDVLPAIYFSGHVGFDRSLRLSSGIQLLGLRAPLPITGTLEAPRPDVSRFLSELLKALGYDILTLPSNVLEQLGRINPLRAFDFLFSKDGEDEQTP